MLTKLRWSSKLVTNTCTLSTCTCLPASLSHCNPLCASLPSLAICSCSGHKSGPSSIEWEDLFPEMIWLTLPWVNWSSSDPSFTVWEAWLGSTSSLKAPPNTQFFQTSLPSVSQSSCGFSPFPSSFHAVSRKSKKNKLSMMRPEFSSPPNTIDSIPQQLLKEPKIIKNTLKITWRTWKENPKNSNREWAKC